MTSFLDSRPPQSFPTPRQRCLAFAMLVSLVATIAYPSPLPCPAMLTPFIPSFFGNQYYLVIVDDFSHYLSTLPLRRKSDTFPTLSHFFAWVLTRFGCTIWGVQCDNGQEFDNSMSRAFFLLRDM
jgi:hypothetical protein